MKTLHTADWHLDQGNLEFTVPALTEAIDKAPEYDLFVHAGDLTVHRGHIHPDVAFNIRMLINKASRKAKYGSIIVAGNHDLNFSAQGVGMVPGILGVTDEHRGIAEMRLVEKPSIISINDHHFVCIPTPSKYTLMQMEAMGDTEAADPAGLMVQTIQGMIAQAADSEPRGPVYVIFHGTVSGSRLGNELVMRAGIDIAVPMQAFKGATSVLAGHIHHRQVMDGLAKGPNVYYPGAAAPFTWNDTRLSPAMYLHTPFKVAVHPIPVLSQMLDLELNIESQETTASEVIASIGTRCTAAGYEYGDRIRVTIRAPGNVISSLPTMLGKTLADDLNVSSVKLVMERTDTATARVKFEKDFTILGAFNDWSKVRAIDPAVAERVMHKVIAPMEVDMVDESRDACYECEPISIKAKNWCQYEDIEIKFRDLGQVVAVTGPNFVGKSNLMRLFLFSRYKKQAAGDKLADLIKHDTDTCTVNEVFQHNGTRYRIERRLKRTTSGGTRTELVFYVWHDDEWQVANEGTASETQAHIESLIGPYDLFRATSYAGQNDVDGLLDLTPSELKDTLLSVLHRDFDGRLCYIRAGIERLSLDRLRIDAATEERKVLEDEHTESSATLEAMAAVLVTARSNRTEARVAHEAQVSRRGRAEAGVEKAKAASDRSADARLRMSATQDDIGEAEVEMNECRDAIQAAEDLGEVSDPPTAKYVDSLMKQADEARELAAEAESALMDGQFAGADLVRNCQSNVDSMLHAFKASEAEQLAAMVNVEHALRQGQTMKDVPCEGKSWQTPGDGERSGWHSTPGGVPVDVDMGGCQFLTDARAATDLLPDLHAKELEAGDAVDAAKSDLDTAEATAAERVAQAERQDADNQKHVDRLNVLVDGARGAFQDANDLYRRAESGAAVRASAVAATGRLTLYETRLTAFHRRLAEDTERVKLHTGEQSEYEASLALSNLELQISEAKRNYNEAADTESAAVESKALVQGTVQSVEKQLDRLAEATAKGSEIETELTYWRIAEEAMHRDGIPYLLLEQFALPTLQLTLNKYLENTDMTVTIDNERELVGGGLRNEVVLLFEDHRGLHPLSAASGFQRTAIGMALRNALADLHAKATGSRIWISIQDEGFGTMDEGNLDRAKATIGTIAKERGYFIFISHVPGMSEIADSEISVVDCDGTSHATTEAVN